LLNMTDNIDSVYNVYTTSGTPDEQKNFLLFNKLINDVPVTNSINNSNFVTGILWDTSDDSNTEFDFSEKEDLIFLTELNKDTVGTYGTYDYELRVPARLRNYKSGDSSSAVFYVELY